MPTCETCCLWLTRVATAYENSDTLVEWQQDGAGKCQGPLRGQVTVASFGCNAHRQGTPIQMITRKSGEPWQHARPGPCPECGGVGSFNDHHCGRCVGTGTVLHYDDGYVGENRTKTHPKGNAPKPACKYCGKPVEQEWVACPNCGVPREVPSATQVIVGDVV